MKDVQRINIRKWDIYIKQTNKAVPKDNCLLRLVYNSNDVIYVCIYHVLECAFKRVAGSLRGIDGAES